MQRYNPKDIEPKWQKIWEETGTYTANLRSDKPKYIAMSMFNYPSGAGIHIGHAMNYTISDVKARFKRQQGYESYHPVGWDAFGLPAENYAIKAGVSPQESMATIIPSYHKQYKAMGWSNDWEKEIATHLPEYYKWTQWIFSQMYKNGLAYQDSRMQWWCPIDKTVLANEQVIDGKCWRHDAPDDPLVQKKEVKQWFFKITDYADELLETIDDLDWTESVKLAQKNWIGKSVGAEIDFAVSDNSENKPNFVILHGFTGRADKGWLAWIKSEIEKKGYRVQVPQMPNTDHPVEKEQVEYVLNNCKFDKNTVLVGHSLGCAVAMKVLQQLPSPIRRLVLVAPTIEPAFRGSNYRNEQPENPRTFVDTFDFKYDYKKLVNQAAERTVLSATQEVSRRPYIKYLSGKIDAVFRETTAEKIHFTAEKELFILNDLVESIKVFTTRADTIFGATFLVLAPEHELVGRITSEAQKAQIEAYIKQAEIKSDVERQENKQKTGVFTGAYAINPASGEKIPIWIADYVLTGYGTGAIMAVPAHDERDFEFAQKFELPVKFVVEPTFGEAQGDDIQSEKVYAVLRNPKTNQVVVLDWGPRQKNYGGNMLIGGTVEDGEQHLAAAEREITEETGYKNLKLVKEAQFKGHGYFYSNTKNINVHASGKGFLFDLVDEAKDAVNLDKDEKEKFKVTWQPVEKVAAMLDDGVHEVMFRYLVLGECYHGEGVMVNSGAYDGLDSAVAREKIVSDLVKQGIAQEKINYKMRDWSVSRQRYWGAPIPIVNCPQCGPVLVPDEDLPVILPELDDFKLSGDGRSALARAKDWLKVDCPQCGGPAERETDTLDTYIDSSWYMYRYFDPYSQEKIFDSDIVKKWEPIDFYNGADHATAHLLYARFIGHFFKKLGLVNEPEPFKQFLFNGKVTAADGTMFSKSKGNGIDPLEIIEQGYGADALRTYLMFAAPLDLWVRWDPQGVPGTHRFLSRIWTLVQEFAEANLVASCKDQVASDEILRATHQMIKKVTEDIEQNHYNTAIAAMMGCVNELYKLKTSEFGKNEVWQQALESLVACAAPFAPHIAEELWHQLGYSTSVHIDGWPKWNEKYLVLDAVTIVVQINGKVRAKLELPVDTSEEEIINAAKADSKIAKLLTGKEIKQTIYISDKLVNFVV